MQIIDISQPVGVATAVWPGDQPFEVDWTMRQDRGDSVNVAAIRLSVHTGTHTDGGFHVAPAGGRPIDVPLERYIGAVRVIDVRGHDAIDEQAIAGVDFTRTPRVLFRTLDNADERKFPERFAAPTPALARALVAAGAQLIGSDAPSMDDVDSKTLEAHHILADGGVATIENLMLSHVEPGEYFLVALPLKLVEADSAPLRAVLFRNFVIS